MKYQEEKKIRKAVLNRMNQLLNIDKKEVKKHLNSDPIIIIGIS